MDSWWGTTATTSIFIAAAITDWLDGYIARKVFSLFTLQFLKETCGNFVALKDMFLPYSID